jgi:hypothetical protein
MLPMKLTMYQCCLFVIDVCWNERLVVANMQLSLYKANLAIEKRTGVRQRLVIEKGIAIGIVQSEFEFNLKVLIEH